GKIGIRIREHHEIGRVLADVPWCRGLLETAALAKDDVHQIPDPESPSPALIAASSISPCSPITTSFDCLMPAPQGLWNWWRTRSTTACSKRRIGLHSTSM